MKFFIAFVALVAVSVASPVLKHKISNAQELEEILAAIQSPSTDPATAALLEEMLADILGVAVGPAIVDHIVPETPVVGPAIIDNEESVSPAQSAPQASKPLVQIILNIRNHAGAIAGIDAAAISPPVAADAVQVVESSVAADSVQVVDLPVSEVVVADLPVADAVQVAHLPVSGVVVADLPAQVVNIPLELK